MSGPSPHDASRRLERQRGQVLRAWRERLAEPRPEEEALLMLDGLVGALDARAPTSETPGVVAKRLARGFSTTEGTWGVELLQAAALGVLEAEAPLASDERTVVLEFFSGVRMAMAREAQARQEQLEQAVVRGEERYLVAARAAGFAVWDWDLSSQSLHWSHSIEALLGHSVDALSSLGLWLEHVHPSDRERVGEGLRNAVEGGRTRWSDAFQFLKRDGTYAGVLGRAWILHDTVGKAVRVVGGLIDVTEQRRLEQELKKAVRVRDDFLSIASHELRTPLTALQIQVQSLTKGPLLAALDGRVKARVEGAERSVGRMIQLVDDLLDVSRVNAGRLELHLEEVNLSELVQEVVTRMQPEVGRSGSQLSMSLPERVTGRWDRSRVDQVFCNLLSNALKYGEGKPVEATVEMDEARAWLRVHDHGIGIAPEEQGRIFERFERSVSDRHFGGFGLGLWIVRRVLDAMGGSIRVQSALGKGATFVVELPRHPVAPEKRVGGQPHSANVRGDDE
ncbi:sensor histidine kinase [Pyxidicoccus sp. MSG2]|uniref:sensor histidine kinase n=1 Tax=Pyxidicoccus sp. MSG2 TaxID=2996790 RepID=UPI0022707E87|nr:sensor histidine kinase [Pyxidicoccus sp. MSG2]MCY1017713.1 ATP-binding protein [Pyxidicoccus sp. MSG2]